MYSVIRFLKHTSQVVNGLKTYKKHWYGPLNGITSWLKKSTEDRSESRITTLKAHSCDLYIKLDLQETH